jgi:hypothetical protein
MKPLVLISMGALAISAAACAGSPATPTPDPIPALTPARSIVGTWKNTGAIPMTLQTDFCLFQGISGGPVANALWNVTWQITAVEGFTNVVDIEMRYASGTAAATGNCRPNGWVPLVSPTFIRAALSGTRIGRSTQDKNQGLSIDGDFTTSQMMITWIHWECLVYCYGEYTADKGLTLFKS